MGSEFATGDTGAQGQEQTDKGPEGLPARWGNGTVGPGMPATPFARVIRVAKTPGETAITRMPHSANSPPGPATAHGGAGPPH